MCCFSRPVKWVSGTRIFARGLADGAQALVYQLTVGLDEELAMVLPLPVPPGSSEDAVRFVDLAGYPRFFDDLERGFPPPMAKGRGPMLARAARAELPRLRVHRVGDFDASFVPSARDFERLDPLFRLPPVTFEAIPVYRDWGFAVFELHRKRGLFGRIVRRPQTFHPMAFVFPRRDPQALFFPTVHVHDGQVHAEASFDHALYAQLDPALASLSSWQRSDAPAKEFVRVPSAQGLVDGEAPLFRVLYSGLGTNRDVVVHADELRARVRDGERFRMRWRLSWNDDAIERFGMFPEHPSWGREMAAPQRRLGEAIAAALERLVVERGAEWELRAYDPDLPAYHPGVESISLPNGAQVLLPSGGCRVAFPIDDKSGSRALLPYALEIELAFARVPPRERVAAVAEALCDLMGRARAAATAG
jgi:hypothetical protein